MPPPSGDVARVRSAERDLPGLVTGSGDTHLLPKPLRHSLLLSAQRRGGFSSGCGCVYCRLRECVRSGGGSEGWLMRVSE